MKLKNIVATLALGLGLCAAAGSASAAVLTFDDLNAFVYGDGAALLPSMSYDGLNLRYVESGFQVTLNAPNADIGAAHVSDGTFEPQTYNWHAGMENGADAFVTVTRVGGGVFNLIGFDYYTDAINVSADGVLVGFLEGFGIWDTALNGIRELRLSSGAFNELDNISVANADPATVPLPGSLPLLLGALAAGALVRRRPR